jgi:hypothetical protein
MGEQLPPAAAKEEQPAAHHSPVASHTRAVPHPLHFVAPEVE